MLLITIYYAFIVNVDKKYSFYNQNFIIWKFTEFYIISDTSDEDEINSEHTYNSLVSSQCQRKAWKVNFEQLGWNFIISPTEFVAYDCSGRCINFMEPSINNHLKMLNILQKRSGCCIPISYESMPIMYYDKFDNVVIKNYDDMMVSDCGCR